MKKQFGKNRVQFYSEKIKAGLGLWLMLRSGNGMGSAVGLDYSGR